MSKLYIIGGQSGAGKSTATQLAEGILGLEHVQIISTDLVRAATRNVFTGQNPDKHIQKVSFTGSATYQSAENPKSTGRMGIGRSNLSEDEVAWLGVLGIIYAYDRDENLPFDVLVEGVAAKPAGVAELGSQLKHLQLWKPVFLGCSDGPDGQAATTTLKAEAEKFKFGYFDRAERPLDEHVQTVVNYLIYN